MAFRICRHVRKNTCRSETFRAHCEQLWNASEVRWTTSWRPHCRPASSMKFALLQREKRGQP
jgi:hypothetical protein